MDEFTERFTPDIKDGEIGITDRHYRTVNTGDEIFTEMWQDVTIFPSPLIDEAEDGE